MPKPSEADEWLQFARDDLAAARLLLAHAELPARLACFHAQEAADKAFKASLAHASIQFRKTHDLSVLLALQPGPVRSEVSHHTCNGSSNGRWMRATRPIFPTSRTAKP